MFKKLFGNPKFILFLILLLTVFAVLIDLPQLKLKYTFNPSQNENVPSFIAINKDFNIDTELGGYELSVLGGRFYRDLDIKQGLDIAGGVSVLLNADMSGIGESDREEAINSLRDVIERRVNLLGISESNVQVSKVGDQYRIIVELAGVFDTEQALSTIGQVAQLEFKTEGEPQEIEIETEEGEEPQEPLVIPDWEDTELSGADLRKATVVFDTSGAVATGQPQIQLQFNSEGTKKFREITENNIDKQVAIFLDDQIVIAPTVQNAITDGQAVITGGFTVDQANILATQLNAGALPVPVEVIEQRTVGPTLGQESVTKSMYAGLIGLLLVMGFMIAYYGRLGIIASVSLIIYAIITLALYKLVPIVLTLPGLTGFILSIGMAVDANILIFERIREEIRSGKPRSLAIENGFGRSWDSIRDANVATLITAFILFNPFDWGFLPAFGPIRGFALTLALGILISLFTGVFITRNLVRVFYRPKDKKEKKNKKEEKDD